MQTMHSKNRTSVAVTGIALLVIMVGLIFYGVSQRTREEAREIDPMVGLAEPENGVGMQPEGAISATGNSAPETGTVEAAQATDATALMTAHPSSAEAAGQLETAPALTTMGSVPDTHVVQPDETLYSISTKYYATHIYAGDIEQLNGLSDPNQIQTGMELKLPRPESLIAVGQ